MLLFWLLALPHVDLGELSGKPEEEITCQDAHFSVGISQSHMEEVLEVDLSLLHTREESHETDAEESAQRNGQKTTDDAHRSSGLPWYLVGLKKGEREAAGEHTDEEGGDRKDGL